MCVLATTDRAGLARQPVHARLATPACSYANGGAHRGPAAIPADPVEQQRLALAQAQASSRRPAGQAAASEEREVAAAIEASLREQHSRRKEEQEDEQLRAAIQASLRCGAAPRAAGVGGAAQRCVGRCWHL